MFSRFFLSVFGAETFLAVLQNTNMPGSQEASETTFTAAFRKREVLLPIAAETDPPLLRIGKADPIQRLEPHSQILPRDRLTRTRSGGDAARELRGHSGTLAQASALQRA